MIGLLGGWGAGRVRSLLAFARRSCGGRGTPSLDLGFLGRRASRDGLGEEDGYELQR
jgi:hypothetical protein